MVDFPGYVWYHCVYHYNIQGLYDGSGCEKSLLLQFHSCFGWLGGFVRCCSDGTMTWFMKG